MTCDFPLLSADISLMRAPQARVTRKMALERRFNSEAVGPLYSEVVRRDKTLLRYQELVGVLSAGL